MSYLAHMRAILLLPVALAAVAACDDADPTNNAAGQESWRGNVAEDCSHCGPYGDLDIVENLANQAEPEAAEENVAAAADPCLMQGSDRLRVTPLRAIGTEPFWAARIQGRCVTYSHPEDQDGTRVWTRYAPGPAGGTWSGTLRGRPFRLRTHAQPGCSDGMSDKRYPIAVELEVDGENRTGCAEPL